MKNHLLIWHYSWLCFAYSERKKMKKLICIIVLAFVSLSYSQWGTSSVKLGYFNPSATEGGFIIGFDAGTFIDKNFSWNFSFDWFQKNYIDKRLVAELNNYYGTSGTINELRAKTNLHDFPVMFNVIVKFPMNPRSQFYVTGGVGAEMLLINYRNFQNPEQDDLEVAFDFNWRIGAGAAFALGARSEVFTEISYHNSNPGWEYEVEEIGFGQKRIFERSYDMSGMMVRVGFRFYY